jgi:hypothetical protein
LLKSHGFTDVSDLIGGYTAWTAAEFDTRNIGNTDCIREPIDGSVGE